MVKNLKFIFGLLFMATFFVLPNVKSAQAIDEIIIDSKYISVDGVHSDEKNYPITWMCNDTMLYLNNYHGRDIKIYGDALIILANGSCSVIRSQTGDIFTVIGGQLEVCVEDNGIANIVVEVSNIDKDCVYRVKSINEFVKNGVVLATIRKV